MMSGDRALLAVFRSKEKSGPDNNDSESSHYFSVAWGGKDNMERKITTWWKKYMGCKAGTLKKVVSAKDSNYGN